MNNHNKFINIMCNIYVIECKSYKYYIGKTNKDPQIRFKEHLNGKGSAWTKIFKPIKLVEYCENQDELVEDLMTMKYMRKYGIENVRGGSYCQVKLTESQKENLSRSLNSAADLCGKCGNPGHFMKYCKEIKPSKAIICDICKRKGHNTDSCYAKTDKNGEPICSRCYRNHYSNNCYAKKDKFGNQIDSDSDSSF